MKGSGLLTWLGGIKERMTSRRERISPDTLLFDDGSTIAPSGPPIVTGAPMYEDSDEQPAAANIVFCYTCNATRDEANLLINLRDSVNICDECVNTCQELAQEYLSRKTASKSHRAAPVEKLSTSKPANN